MNLKKYTLVIAVLAATQSACSTSTKVASDERAPASEHDEVTPYNALKQQLLMKPGVTYMTYMKETVYPAMQSFGTAIGAEETKYPNQYSRWQKDLTKTGSGVAIRIDAKNYIFNVGYHDASKSDATTLKNDVKSGRSYGIGPTEHESDPSDIAYLTELGNYFKSEPGNMDKFFHAILLATFNNDTSGWASLSQAGQIVATDFIAIYTAEAARHIMVKLDPRKHPWEVDLAAATFVSTFVTTTGQIMQNVTPDADTPTYRMKPGTPTQWWAKGQVGSGIGETRQGRLALQKAIAAYELSKSGHPDLVKAIVAITGTPKGNDVINDVFEYLSAPKGPRSIKNVTAQGGLMDLFLQYMAAVRQDAPNILASMAAQQTN